MIHEKHLVDFKSATPEQKRKIADIMIANYTQMVEEFVEKADWATTTGYWRNFTPQTFWSLSAEEFIEKYKHIIGE
jgi:roadblock/LC7 domain-containing protein